MDNVRRLTRERTARKARKAWKARKRVSRSHGNPAGQLRLSGLAGSISSRLFFPGSHVNVLYIFSSQPKPVNRTRLENGRKTNSPIRQEKRSRKSCDALISLVVRLIIVICDLAWKTMLFHDFMIKKNIMGLIICSFILNSMKYRKSETCDLENNGEMLEIIFLYKSYCYE